MGKSLFLTAIAVFGLSIVTTAQSKGRDAENGGSKTLSVATVQMRLTDDLAENVEHINTVILDCASKGARVVVFPEVALSGGSEKVISKLTKEQIDQAEKKIAATCRKASVYAIVGMPWRNDQKYYLQL